jgi:hypothetical protein
MTRDEARRIATNVVKLPNGKNFLSQSCIQENDYFSAA